jgi:hypothetical protein
MPESERSAETETGTSAPAPAEQGESEVQLVSRPSEVPQKKPTAKETAVTEFRELLINALYLALFLCAFNAYRALVTGELLHRAVYIHLGSSIITAVIIAKMIMIGGWLNLGGRSNSDEPLITRTLYRSLIYSGFVIVSVLVEKAVEGLVHGRGVRESLRLLAHLGWDEIGARAIVMLLALIPFFAFRELADREGRDKVYRLFFHRRASQS